MLFGVCWSPENAAVMADAGFDFMELNVQAHLKPQESDAWFASYLPVLQSARPPCLAANCFVPGNLKICGPETEPEKLAAYVAVALRRARQAGMKTIVFGSGGARRIPDGFSRDQAWNQLVEFGRMTAVLAAREQITIAVEPLNRAECNVLTAVGESARYVREVNHPSFRLLVDAYHWLKDDDSWDDLVAAGPLLSHVHIATRNARLAPGGEACDFGPFFAALRAVGYAGPVSIECGSKDLGERPAHYLSELRKAAGASN